MVDTSDIRELTAKDFARGRKNPYAEKIRKHGLTISVSEYFSPDDVINIVNGSSNRLEMTTEELEAFEEYRKANGDVDCEVLKAVV